MFQCNTTNNREYYVLNAYNTKYLTTKSTAYSCELSQNMLCHFESVKVHYHTHMNYPLELGMSQMVPGPHSHTFNTNLPSTSRSPKWLHLYRSSN